MSECKCWGPEGPKGTAALGAHKLGSYSPGMAAGARGACVPN